MLLPTLQVLYSYISTVRSMCAMPSMAVVCSSLSRARQLCSSRIF